MLRSCRTHGGSGRHPEGKLKVEKRERCFGSLCSSRLQPCTPLCRRCDGRRARSARGQLRSTNPVMHTLLCRTSCWFRRNAALRRICHEVLLPIFSLLSFPLRSRRRRQCAIAGWIAADRGPVWHPVRRASSCGSTSRYRRASMQAPRSGGLIATADGAEQGAHGHRSSGCRLLRAGIERASPTADERESVRVDLPRHTHNSECALGSASRRRASRARSHRRTLSRRRPSRRRAVAQRGLPPGGALAM